MSCHQCGHLIGPVASTSGRPHLGAAWQHAELVKYGSRRKRTQHSKVQQSRALLCIEADDLLSAKLCLTTRRQRKARTTLNSMQRLRQHFFLACHMQKHSCCCSSYSHTCALAHLCFYNNEHLHSRNCAWSCRWPAVRYQPCRRSRPHRQRARLALTCG